MTRSNPDSSELENRTITLRKDGPLQGWSVWIDDRRASPSGLSHKQARLYLQGLWTGNVEFGSGIPVSRVVENDHRPVAVIRRAARSLGLKALYLAAMLIWIAAALFVVVNLLEIVRIVASDWDGSHFAEHAAMEVVAAAIVWLYIFGQARIRARWRWLPRL